MNNDILLNDMLSDLKKLLELSSNNLTASQDDYFKSKVAEYEMTLNDVALFKMVFGVNQYGYKR